MLNHIITTKVKALFTSKTFLIPLILLIIGALVNPFFAQFFEAEEKTSVNISSPSMPNNKGEINIAYNQIGLTKEELKTTLTTFISQAIEKKKSLNSITDAKELQILTLQLEVANEKLDNLQASYEDTKKLLVKAEGTLQRYKNQLPERKLLEAKKDLFNGNTLKAESAFEEIINNNGTNIAEAAFQAGNLAKLRFDFNKALKQYEKAYILAEDNLQYLGSYASLLHKLGQFDKAIVIYKKAIAVSTKQFGEKDVNTLIRKNNLATIYKTQANYEQAQEILKEIIKTEEQKNNTDNKSLAVWYNNLATVYEDLAKYELAELDYLKAIEIGEKVYKNDDVILLTWFNNLSSLYEKQGKYHKSLAVYHNKNLIDLAENIYGKNSPVVAQWKNNLGTIYYSLGMYEEAKPRVSKFPTH